MRGAGECGPVMEGSGGEPSFLLNGSLRAWSLGPLGVDQKQRRNWKGMGCEPTLPWAANGAGPK